MKVPNQFPSIDPVGAERIAIVGQSPGDTEVREGRPFCGPSGALLTALLSQAGISREQCFVGNVCQVQPVGNQFDTLDWHGAEVQEGIAQLKRDLLAFQPSIVLCLGNEALHLLKEGNDTPPPRKGKQYAWPNSVSNWRGSLFRSALLPGVKCLATYHPAAVLREWSFQPYVQADMRRLAAEAKSPALELPQRSIAIAHDLSEIRSNLALFRERKAPLAFDIEGYCGNMTCFSLAYSAEYAYVVPLARQDGTSVWSEEDEVAILQALRELLEDPTVPKILQNGLYDAFVLAWTYGISIRNQAHDTLLLWWELFAELEKSLSVQASILTKEPYYKAERLALDDRTAWEYCGKDAAVTWECWNAMMHMAQPGQLEHYRFNVELLPACLYMELRGMRYDKERARAEREAAEREAYALQARIDQEAAKDDLALSAFYCGTLDEATLVSFVLSRLCCARPRERRTVTEERWQPMRWNGKKWVKAGKPLGSLPAFDDSMQAGDEPTHDKLWLKPCHCEVERLIDVKPATLAECEPYILESKRAEWRRVKQLWKEISNEFRESYRDSDAEDTGGNERTEGESHRASDLLALKGELASVLSISLNVGSTSAEGDAQRFLYEICGLPRQFKKVKGKKTEVVSSDQNALTRLYAVTQDVRVLWVLQLRRLRKLASDLSVPCDDDGRMRSAFSLVKETGRMAASKSPTGNGNNLQAWNKDLRHLMVADEGCVMRQRDLEGADSWTVAAECAALGDPTMLEDLRAGLKPAKVLTLLRRYGAVVNDWSRDEIKARLKAEKFESWEYPAAKSAVHGSSYGMGIPTMLQTILKYSLADLPLVLEEAKPIVLTHEQGKQLQAAFFLRYAGVRKWHAAWTAQLVKGKAVLETSAGHVRRFYGRKRERKGTQWVANHDTLKEVLASAPQFYTTFATKRALWALWYDALNRRDDGSLKTEPLYAVHDSLLMQCAESELEDCLRREQAWFGTPVRIAGIDIVIPSEAQQGHNWGMKD